jgi:hypothetical protein
LPPPWYSQAFCCRVFSMKGTVVPKAKALSLPVKNRLPVCVISTLSCATASSTCNGGTISPAAKGWMRKRPPVISATCRARNSPAPK